MPAQTGTLSPEEVARRAETRVKNAAATATVASYLSEHKEDLPDEFVGAINQLINLTPRRAVNSLYVRILDFLQGNKVQGVDIDPPNKGDEVDDLTLFMAFRVADTDMNKVIYQGQDEGIWISAVKEGRETKYAFFCDGPKFVESNGEVPDGYVGPVSTRRVQDKS